MATVMLQCKQANLMQSLTELEGESDHV